MVIGLTSLHYLYTLRHYNTSIPANCANNPRLSIFQLYRVSRHITQLPVDTDSPTKSQAVLRSVTQSGVLPTIAYGLSDGDAHLQMVL